MTTDANLTSDNQPTTPEPKKRLLPRPEVPSVQEQKYIDAVDASTRRMGKTTNTAAKLIEEHNLPTPADKVCPRCGGDQEILMETYDGYSQEATCPDCHGKGRIAGTSTPDRSKAQWRWYSFCSAHREIDPTCTACHGGEWINENDPEVIADRQLFKDDPKAWRKKHNPDVQPVSPNGDDELDGLIERFTLSPRELGLVAVKGNKQELDAAHAINAMLRRMRPRIKALIAQRTKEAHNAGVMETLEGKVYSEITIKEIVNIPQDVMNEIERRARQDERVKFATEIKAELTKRHRDHGKPYDDMRDEAFDEVDEIIDRLTPRKEDAQ